MTTMIRQLSNEEMADLPNMGWNNAKVDVNTYFVSFDEAFEVDEHSYNIFKDAGYLCQIVNGKFIVTNG